jgi:hypothetical protein
MFLPDTLISIKAVDVRIGKVTAANINTIVIDGVTYTTPADLMFADTYVGETVRYFLYNGVLIDLEECADTSSDDIEVDYKLMDFIGDSKPELFILEKSKCSDIPDLYYGEFDGYFYNMVPISAGCKFMISEKNKAVACITNNEIRNGNYKYYSVELIDFAPDETKINGDGEIIFNKYEEFEKTSIYATTRNADGVYDSVSYISGPSIDNPDGPIDFLFMDGSEYTYSTYSKELFIEKMNEYDSYGWTEMEFDEYKLK